MTYHDVYIGRLAEGRDRVDWGGDPRIGNTARSLPGTLFPPNLGHAFRLLVAKIEHGKLPGKQVDWGAWAAIVSKNDIIAFIEEAYAGDRTYSDPNYMPHLYPKLHELLAVVGAFAEDERLALVASELRSAPTTGERTRLRINPN